MSAVDWAKPLVLRYRKDSRWESIPAKLVGTAWTAEYFSSAEREVRADVDISHPHYSLLRDSIFVDEHGAPLNARGLPAFATPRVCNANFREQEEAKRIANEAEEARRKKVKQDMEDGVTLLKISESLTDLAKTMHDVREMMRVMHKTQKRGAR